MKPMRTIKYLFLLFGLVTIFSCSKNDFDVDKDEKSEKEEINFIIKLDKISIAADNNDAISFIAERNEKDVTSETTFFVDGKKIEGNIFRTNSIKEYTAYAKIGDLKSKEVKFKSHKIDDISYMFVHKVLVEDYTAAWCGFCPLFISYLEEYKNNDNFIPVAIHPSDAMKSRISLVLKTYFSVDGYPLAIINRRVSQEWYGEDPKTLIKDKAPVAISLKTVVSNNQAKIDVKVNFDKKHEFSSRLKLVVILLEDEVVADQANYLSGKAEYKDIHFYNLDNPIKDFKHMHVLRMSATDIMGDLIPVEFVTNSSEYTKSYTLDISAYNADKCHIVAFIDQEDSQKKLGVLNAQRVKLGESIFY